MNENGDFQTIKRINTECFHVYRERTKQNDFKNIHELMTGTNIKDLGPFSNDYQKIWDKNISSLPRAFEDSDFSGDAFFYGPRQGYFSFKSLRKCNFSNTFWVYFKYSDNCFTECNFSNSLSMLSGGIQNKFLSCDFSNAVFLEFYPYGGNIYEDCNFTNAKIHSEDLLLDASKFPDITFNGSIMKDCELTFDCSFNKKLVKKLPKSRLKEYINHLFTPEQVAQMKIDYNRFW
jgi:uncharacterized protein YjbI with pentapeptide repeats